MTRRGRTLTLTVGGTLAILLLVVGYLMPVPYVRIRPGPVFNALGELDGRPIVSVEGAQTYDTEGALNITTVVEDGAPGGRLTLFQAFRGWLDPTMSVVPRELLYPPEDFEDEDASDELRRQGIVQMRTSEQSAVVAALRFVGEPVSAVVVVSETVPDTPADGVLEPGDVFVAVDGTRIVNAGDVREVVTTVEPGDEVVVSVAREGEIERYPLTTIPSSEDPERAMIGVVPGVSFKSPVDVSFSLADVGGPSAGLMFALSVVDKLTPGSLVQSEAVAGTGEISPRGRVGPIGGIAQKMAGARESGADFFLAPVTNCDDVVGHIPEGLQVIAVKSLDDAVTSLEQLDLPDAQLPSCDA